MKKLTTLIAAFLFTTGMAFAQNNDATSTQNGNDNEVTISQIGNLNVATSTQTGNGSEITIEQTGSENNAIANHKGNGSIDQLQNGMNNDAQAFASSNATISQTQLGDDNVALVGVTRGPLNQRSAVTQFQDGYRNHAEVEIRQGNGRINTILQSQIGNDNSALIQDLGNVNNITQIQEGDNNSSTVGNVGNPQLGGMTVLTDQYGDNNTATVYGSQNAFADIFQTGDMNVASIVQTAGSDMATITQTGNGNSASIVQQ